MKQKIINQFEFPSVLYDTLFGLVLYFNMDSFLTIEEPLHFALYLCTFILVIHWWLMFKSAADVFGEETQSSALNLVLNIVCLILINYVVLTSGAFEYRYTAYFLVALLALDVFWAVLWRYIRRWETDNHERREMMDREAEAIIRVDALLLGPIAALAVFGGLLSAPAFVAVFIASYAAYIFLTFRWGVVDLRIL